MNRRTNQHHVIPLNRNSPDSHQIIRQLNWLIDRFGRMPEVRDFALDVIFGDTGNHNQAIQLRELSSWMRDHFRYVLDPDGTEYVISPLRLIQDFSRTGRMSGDCDDHVLFAGAVMLSVGIPSFAVGVNGFSDSTRFDHVINAFEIGGEIAMWDFCRKGISREVTGRFSEILTG